MFLVAISLYESTVGGSIASRLRKKLIVFVRSIFLIFFDNQ